MADEGARPEQFGLSDDALASHRTVFAADALKDMVVVLSGAGGGIGRAIAWLFSRLGARVAVVGRDQTKLDALQSALEARGYRATSHTIDIKEADAVASLFSAISNVHGQVDILINSAGGQFP